MTHPSQTIKYQAKAEEILEEIIKQKGGSRRPGQVELAKRTAHALRANDPSLIEGGTGVGKALDVNTPIPTLEGFIRMGDLKAGEHHPFDEQGNPCNITDAYDVLYGRTCYKITFSDGTWLIADAAHLWNTITRAAFNNKENRANPNPWAGAVTRTTQQILDDLSFSDGQPKHRIPLAAALNLPERNLTIDPYELGVWLGSSPSQSLGKSLIASHKTGKYISGLNLTHFNVEAHQRVHTIAPTPQTNELLAQYGLSDTQRFVPAEYIFSSYEQRMSLLKGFMDVCSDLNIPPKREGRGNPQIVFSKANQLLMENMRTIINSLGMRVTLQTAMIGTYRVTIWQGRFTPTTNVFTDPAKAKTVKQDITSPKTENNRSWFRMITSIEKVESRPVRCISVDSPNSLYLAGKSLIPTHNSLGYIAGAIASGKRTFVSPHTINLQDQLKKDLDLVTEVLRNSEIESIDPRPIDGQSYDEDNEEFDNDLSYSLKDFSYTLLKGRSSYICLNRAYAMLSAGQDEDPQQEAFNFASNPEEEKTSQEESTSELFTEIKSLIEWAENSETGDRTEAPQHSPQAWAMICAGDDCAGFGCTSGESKHMCFAEEAHQRAMSADIIVGNQSLLAMHMKVPYVNIGKPEAVVVDEAHEFPHVVAKGFGAELTRKRIEHVMTVAINMLKKDKIIEPEKATKWKDDLWKVLDDFYVFLDQKTHKYEADCLVISDAKVKGYLNEIANLFAPIKSKCSTAVTRAEADGETEKKKRQVVQRTVDNLVEDLGMIAAGSNNDQVTWAERVYSEITLNSAQFDSSETMYRTLIDRVTGGAVVFTSATLTIGGSFRTSATRLGLANVNQERGREVQLGVVPSPFNYPEQGRIWFPDDMPAPSNKKEDRELYNDAVAETAIKVARAAGGRTLVLCTANNTVEQVSDALNKAFKDTGVTVLTQKRGVPSGELAAKFAADPKTVLVGTRSFWTGVSVDGDSCVAVVIDKMPFPSPSDPMVAALSDKIDRTQGRGKGFVEVSLAEAILTVVQGVGRLIRTVNDRGMVVICDPRLNERSQFKKSYRGHILSSLPAFTVVHDENAAMQFLMTVNTEALAREEADIPMKSIEEAVEAGSKTSVVDDSAR